MRIENDKYYTPIALANKCWGILSSIVDMTTITEIIEPSCGNGAFYHSQYKVDVGYDVAPEVDGAIKGDYLMQDIAYKRGRLVIGNPPFGDKLSLAQKFYRKSCAIADYVAFILPISQLDNVSSLYEFDLIKSVDLGKEIYTDRELHCCFNVYKRPVTGVCHKKAISKLEDITIYRQDSKGYDKAKYDIRLCYWGNGCAGKVLSDDEHYSAEYKIKVNNPDIRDRVVFLLETFDWSEYLNCIASRKIQQFHIIDVLRKNIADIK